MQCTISFPKSCYKSTYPQDDIIIGIISDILQNNDEELMMMLPIRILNVKQMTKRTIKIS